MNTKAKKKQPTSIPQKEVFKQMFKDESGLREAVEKERKKRLQRDKQKQSSS